MEVHKHNLNQHYSSLQSSLFIYLIYHVNNFIVIISCASVDAIKFSLPVYILK